MPSVSNAASSVQDFELDPLVELREASATPTPLSGMLQDASILRSFIGHRKSRRGSTSSQRNASRDRSKDSRKPKKDTGDTESILTLVLAEEERQAHHLKAVLRATGDRLESEMRRSDQLEERARTAENRAREATGRATAAESARHLAELDAARAREEIARYRLIAETAERELRKAEGDVQRLDRLKSNAEQAAADAKDTARKAQQTLREWQAREEGRAEGVRIELTRRYEDGREDGYEDGRAEGFEAGRREGFEEGKAEGMHTGRTEGQASGRLAGFDEGRQVGYREGYDEGYNEGRKEERAKALEAFDKFIDRELDKQSADDDEPSYRTHEWVEATRSAHQPEYRASRPPSPKPIRPPAETPNHMREPSPAPVPVWLRRQPRMATPPAPIIYGPPQVQV